MTKHAPTTNAFTPGDSYVREDNVVMVEVRPGVYVNAKTAWDRHGIMPKKAKRGEHHGSTQGT
jgi:hypothetical protein